MFLISFQCNLLISVCKVSSFPAVPVIFEQWLLYLSFFQYNILPCVLLIVVTVQEAECGFEQFRSLPSQNWCAGHFWRPDFCNEVLEKAGLCFSKDTWTVSLFVVLCIFITGMILLGPSAFTAVSEERLISAHASPLTYCSIKSFFLLQRERPPFRD